MKCKYCKEKGHVICPTCQNAIDRLQRAFSEISHLRRQEILIHSHCTGIEKHQILMKTMAAGK